MKKLILKKFKLSEADLLQREQLKTVLGGGYNPCTDGLCMAPGCLCVVGSPGCCTGNCSPYGPDPRFGACN